MKNKSCLNCEFGKEIRHQKDQLSQEDLYFNNCSYFPKVGIVVEYAIGVKDLEEVADNCQKWIQIS
jgi:hypothetical protein